jgi:uncharacterized protein
MSLAEQIQSDLTTAMKARDAETTKTLRMVVAAIKNARVAGGRGEGDLTDEEVLDLVAKEAKKRTEAATAYADAGRPELAATEEAELAIIRRYLPEPLTADALAEVVDATIAEVGASGPQDMGRVMSAVMPKVKGRADGKQVSAAVKARLT